MSPWRTLQCLRPGAVEMLAGQRQHVQREIDPEATLDFAGEKLKHAPGTGAEIE